MTTTQLIVRTAVLTLLSGCISQNPPRSLSECPPVPRAECSVELCRTPMLDTLGQQPHQRYWKVRAVRGLNSEAQEYAVQKMGETRALLTKGDERRTEIVQVHFVEKDSATVETTLSLPDSLNCGFVGSRNVGDEIVIAEWNAAGNPRQSLLRSATLRPNDMRCGDMIPGCADTASWYSHPCVSSDGSLLFFASDQPGGFGGTDIWYKRRQADGSWSDAVNAGPEINTACDELCPFLCADNVSFLFSSCGHQSYGGYDVMQATLSAIRGSSASLQFSQVHTLPAPINSSSDELFAYSFTDPMADLYFSSDRRERGNFDIYCLHSVVAVDSTPAPAPSITQDNNDLPPTASPKQDSVELHGRVYRNHDSIARHAEVLVFDHRTSRVIRRTNTNDSGDYRVRVPRSNDIEVIAQTTQGFFDSYRVRAYPKDTTTGISFDFHIPDILALRINFPENVFLNPYTNVLDSNGTETSQQWKDLLDVVAQNLKKSLTNIKKVVLVGHTDENGSIEYNQDLGRRRVAFVVDQLVARGLPRALFDAQSAGELQPLPRRKDEALESYNKRNRRVELTKLMR